MDRDKRNFNRQKQGNNESTPVVLFYPTGIVHFRNLEILKKSLPEFTFRVIVEPWVNGKAPEVLDNTNPADRVTVKNGQLPREEWENVRILFLSMAYPNLFRLGMVYEAVKRGIPVIAIEEVNQLALNDGMINHYFLPLDYLGVPSNEEREKFLQLGLADPSLMVTGWPFFDYEGVLENHRYFDMKKKYNLQRGMKFCLLVLSSLKERDIVSLETRKVRQEILQTVSTGLSDVYQLLIKPHPIETEAGLQEIRKQVPDAILLDPKAPIETLLAQSDLVVNRGNSQVTLLAMLRKKPVIVVPVGLKTIFHGTADFLISNSPSEFRRMLVDYSRGEAKDYQKILGTHFPFTQKQALEKVRLLFTTALNKGTTDRMNTMNRKFHISIFYAFLGEVKRAREILEELPEHPVIPLLKRLYHQSIKPEGFRVLLENFPGKVLRWHLQALYIRAAGRNCLTSLLDGFDGDVNPHYFIDDLIRRVELEYRSGNHNKAEALMEKFYEDYFDFDCHRQAFEMLRFVYSSRRKYRWFRKVLWLLKNLNKAYTRKCIKRIFKR
jgi:hypothetical protein